MDSSNVYKVNGDKMYKPVMARMMPTIKIQLSQLEEGDHFLYRGRICEVEEKVWNVIDEGRKLHLDCVTTSNMVKGSRKYTHWVGTAKYKEVEIWNCSRLNIQMGEIRTDLMPSYPLYYELDKKL